MDAFIDIEISEMDLWMMDQAAGEIMIGQGRFDLVISDPMPTIASLDPHASFDVMEYDWLQESTTPPQPTASDGKAVFSDGDGPPTGWTDADTIHGPMNMMDAMDALDQFVASFGDYDLFQPAAFESPTPQNVDSDEIEAAERALEVVIAEAFIQGVAFVEYDENTGVFIVNAPAVG